MAKKFLSKEGLDRFYEKIKSKFALLDSPVFKGRPTVETPEIETTTERNQDQNKQNKTKKKHLNEQ